MAKLNCNPEHVQNLVVQVIAQALKDNGLEVFEDESILNWMYSADINPETIKQAYTDVDGNINLRYIMERLDQ
jgi:hypothetical protein